MASPCQQWTTVILLQFRRAIVAISVPWIHCSLEARELVFKASKHQKRSYYNRQSETLPACFGRQLFTSQSGWSAYCSGFTSKCLNAGQLEQHLQQKYKS